MANKEFYKSHSNGTKTKLEIFDRYFKESLPVFIHSPFFEEIYIYDLFAGKGKDENGENGTSLNILSGIIPHCEAIKLKKKNIYVILNDKQESDTLSDNVTEFLNLCDKECVIGDCIFRLDKNLIVKANDFEDYFNETIYPRLKYNKKAAKIIFLDPFNFVMNELLFEKLTSLTSTDFICFMPSFYLRRFKNTNAFENFIKKENLNFDETRANECHRVIANYFETLVKNKEYYIGYFSIKYNSAYYGVVFGSNHTFGAEKFQKVCWGLDPITGEADYNIDRELTYGGQGVLFEEESVPEKTKKFKENVREKILVGVLKTDVAVYKYALKNRCLPKMSVEVLKELMKEDKIEKIKTHSSDIHLLKEPLNIILK